VKIGFEKKEIPTNK